MDLFETQSRKRLLRHAREQLEKRKPGLINPKNRPFFVRFDANAPLLLDTLLTLYGNQADFSHAFVQLCTTLAESWVERPGDLQMLDAKREQSPGWFVSETMAGAVCYVDLWAGSFEGLEKKIPYLQSLGITYLHLMPVFQTPEPENDGGYAVSSYRDTAPHLGTFDGLRRLLRRLREAEMVTVLDFINNHTSSDHLWAKKAVGGEYPFTEFYYLFEDPVWPDRFGRTLREIFPEVRRGCFSFHEEMQRWVWTTFHNYQWDLNYRNPHLFAAMTAEMLHLANAGADILRLDAVPFVWKQEGTSCENLDEAHTLIEALNLCARIAAPGLLFKSEAIVHPDDVIRYVTPKKCQLSYNPTVMATMWEALATRNTALLRKSIRHRFGLPEGTSWVNYVRSHDDIGWTFSDEDAYAEGMDPVGHRSFLNQFYSGQFEGSFAKGATFQYNPENGDMRICGTAASLCGIEKALDLEDEAWLRDGVARLLLLYGITFSIGGIPLLYLGDEWASLNDDTYKQDPAKRLDSRWVHRSRMNWDRAERLMGLEDGFGDGMGNGMGDGFGDRLGELDVTDYHLASTQDHTSLQDDTSMQDHTSMQDRASMSVFHQLQRMLRIRASQPAFAENKIDLSDLEDPALLLYRKGEGEQEIWVAANFSEQVRTLPSGSLTSTKDTVEHHTYTDLLSNELVSRGDGIPLGPCQIRWLVANRLG